MKLAIVILLLLPGVQNIFPQQNKYEFDKFKTSDENFPKVITSVVKDKVGFVWFATDVGLYRFDGYNFKAYFRNRNDSKSISSNKLLCICDDDNYLWIGTLGGLNRFNKTTEEFKIYKFNREDESTLEYNDVMAIHISNNKELWIVTSTGLKKYDRENDKFTRYDLDSEGFRNPSTLYKDKDNDLWIGTWSRGVYKYNPVSKIFTHYQFSSGNPNSLSSDRINSILEDNNGDIWIATADSGINKFDKIKEEFHRFKYDSLKNNSLIGDQVSRMSKGLEGLLWIATSEGISIIDPVTNVFTNIGKKEYPALSDIKVIYTDEMGIVWICKSKEASFVTYNKYKWKFNYYDNLLNYNSNESNLLSFGEDIKENIWIGSNNGIDVINKNKEKIRHFENNPNDTTSLFNNSIFCIYRDKKNYMWIGKNENGPLEKYDPETESFIHFYDFDGTGFNTHVIFEDKDENLWLGLWYGGLRVFDKNRNLKKKYLTAENDFEDYGQISINDISQDVNGYMYIGTNQGLAMIDPKTDSVIFYRINPNDTNKINSDRVSSLCIKKKGYWVLTTNAGMYDFDTHTKNFKHCSIGNGQNNEIFFGMQSDNNGNLWIQSTMSLSMFNPDNGSSINYNEKEGIPGKCFNTKSDFKSKDGEMFFGWDGGFTSFYPDSIRLNKIIPTIVLTNFKVFDKEVKLDTSITQKKLITISYKENFFSFDYAALDYTIPEKNQHAYMLEGIDKEWNNVGNIRTANYTDIEPGEYTFRVKGSNNDGVWNEEGTSVKLIITPPWWQTWWFKSCGAAIIFMTVGFGYKKRVSKLKKEKTAQEEFSRRLIESQEEERKRIASALHDTIAHDILLTKSKALLALRNPDDIENLKNALTEISDMSSETINDVRGISYNLHPHQLERLGFSEAIESIIKDVSRASDIEFSVKVDNVDDVISKEAEINLYRVIQEGINNIIKHSKATEAELKVIRLENQIIVSISDNGIGLASDKNLLRTISTALDYRE
ncbi:MAG: hypothetical protein IPL53_14160 [Ignavibacteria bacterium]|nr:hypothetical protein [Ignavibacteria bacterium]